MSGFQQYGMGGGAVQLSALTVAGVGMAAGAVGNVVSGIGSLFSSSEQTDPARTVEAPNGGDPVAEDAFTAPMPQRRPTEQGSGRGSVIERPGEREAANKADNPTSPADQTSVSDFNKLDYDSSVSESRLSKIPPGGKVGADYLNDDGTIAEPKPPSSGEQQAAPFDENNAY
jgi:hypothetical protein